MGPIEEVAQLFFGIFVSMIPAMAILKAGTSGALSPLVELVSRDGQPVNAMYFWLTGILSSFLDNAPTYMVFFNTAGGDAQTPMHHMPETLAAISAGAVFMGACSYIGNAPNFMVRAIAEDQGVRMPGFFIAFCGRCAFLCRCLRCLHGFSCVGCINGLTKIRAKGTMPAFTLKTDHTCG